MSDHAKMSPSAAHRWLKCIGSLRYDTEQYHTTSPAADRGTMLHELASKCLEDSMVTLDATDLPEGDVEVVDDYLAYIGALMHELGPRARLLVEQRVQLDDKIWGTADAIILSPYRIDIIDFKTGSQPVSPMRNPQMLTYLACCMNEFNVMPSEIHYETEPVDAYLHIVQPPVGIFESWKIGVNSKEFKDFKSALKLARDKYVNQVEEYSPDEDACRYCKGASICRARAEYNVNLALKEFELADPKEIDVNDLSELLPKLDQIQDWIDKVKTHAHKLAMSGTGIPGYKLVAYNGMRSWKDPELAIQSLVDMGFPPSTISKSTPIAIGQVEKLIGKNHEFFRTHTKRPDPRPVMAPVSDSREEWKDQNPLDGL